MPEKTDAERAEMYRRNLGGTERALQRARSERNRLYGENRLLRELVRDLWQAYSDASDRSFHPHWGVEPGLAERVREFGTETEVG